MKDKSIHINTISLGTRNCFNVHWSMRRSKFKLLIKPYIEINDWLLDISYDGFVVLAMFNDLDCNEIVNRNQTIKYKTSTFFEKVSTHHNFLNFLKKIRPPPLMQPRYLHLPYSYDSSERKTSVKEMRVLKRKCIGIRLDWLINK